MVLELHAGQQIFPARKEDVVRAGTDESGGSAVLHAGNRDLGCRRTDTDRRQLQPTDHTRNKPQEHSAKSADDDALRLKAFILSSTKFKLAIG